MFQFLLTENVSSNTQFGFRTLYSTIDAIFRTESFEHRLIQTIFFLAQY